MKVQDNHSSDEIIVQGSSIKRRSPKQFCEKNIQTDDRLQRLSSIRSFENEDQDETIENNSANQNQWQSYMEEFGLIKNVIIEETSDEQNEKNSMSEKLPPELKEVNKEYVKASSSKFEINEQIQEKNCMEKEDISNNQLQIDDTTLKAEVYEKESSFPVQEIMEKFFKNQSEKSKQRQMKFQKLESKMGMTRPLYQTQQNNQAIQKPLDSGKWRLKLNQALAGRSTNIRKADSVSPPKLPTVSDFEGYEFFAEKPSLSVYQFKDKFKNALDQPNSIKVNHDRIRRVTRQLIYGQLLNAVENETENLPAEQLATLIEEEFRKSKSVLKLYMHLDPQPERVHYVSTAPLSARVNVAQLEPSLNMKHRNPALIDERKRRVQIDIQDSQAKYNYIKEKRTIQQ